MSYNPQAIEKKWQTRWEQKPVACTKPADSGKKYYCLDMFPYPSGSGLHIGHWKSYVLSDLYARIKWLDGYNVLHPMGWDAFGSPAENDAIKKGIHPSISTANNIANFKRQLKEIGCLYDWNKEINTTDPQYYKWTQWIFLQMYKAGLAYRANKPINWCPSCKTGIANEEVVNGCCERCGTHVTQKQIPQWILKITTYAEQLLSGLDTLDWPEKVKHMQRNWIGKSEGCLVTFTTTDHHGKPVEIPVFTTRPDTLFGATYLVLAPELSLVRDIVAPTNLDAVRTYQQQVEGMTPFQRQLDKDKTGVFTGAYAINPVNGHKLPIYLASYVLSDYGTGAIMAVPGHDTRDFEFATQHQLPIIQVIEGTDAAIDSHGKLTAAYEDNGLLINSGFLNGLTTQQAFQTMAEWLITHGKGERKVHYKFRDWIFSRQRYWGEPIPLVHCPACGIVPVPEDQLPVLLPDVERYEPTGTGQSPLATITEWVNTTCPICGGPAERETNTMPQWAGSCWYFLRYPDPQLKDKAWALNDVSYWLPVDLYVGGIEHAILHLLYARFYVKFLAEAGYLPFDEPFKRLFNQGMILRYSEKSGQVEKMSKSKGNVVNPDDIVSTYGADILRMYIMFMGPPELDCEWQDNGLEGIKRFLNRLWVYLTTPKTIITEDAHESEEAHRRVQLFLNHYQERLENFKPNTAVSSLMEFLNDAIDQHMQLSKQSVQDLLVSLSVFTPYIASELLEQLLGKQLANCAWPHCDKSVLAQQPVIIAIQVNGKTRVTITVAKNSDKKTIEELAQQAARKWLEHQQIIKVIFVPDRLVNFVIRKI